MIEMVEIDLSTLGEAPFVDNSIKNYEFDWNEKTLVINFDGACLDIDENPWLDAARLEVSNWSSLKVLKKKGEVCTELSYFPKIDTILEFNLHDNILTLLDWGTEEPCDMIWVFTDPEVKCYGHFDKN